MAKKKVSRFESWDEVGVAIGNIGQCRMRIKKAENALNASIAELKASYEEQIKEDLETAEDLEEQVKLFTNAHKADFADRKTKEFVYGEVGFRKSTEIITRNVKAIIEALKQHKMDDCIKVSEKLDKDVMATYDDKALTAVGAKRSEKDNYFMKIYEERLG